MSFGYDYKNKEANFGSPLGNQVDDGMHITFEIILKKDDKFMALRRPKEIPNHQLPEKARDFPKGLLFFCHDLIRYGESVEDCVERIVNKQAGVSVKDFEIAYIDSVVQEKDKQWAFTPHLIAEVDKIPEANENVSEVVLFDKDSIPEDFAFWSKEDLKEFIDEVEK
jgi:ADP-ribose pyrophosphatase YjhB (NUDIX family)